ncbi:hypothetical protein SAMD00024442_4_6 [Candidatus Symbiothrix dinenymphae]|nr:hypothetical protein SAMD00024442_4_6 [Candidatus Symbiothrix dinenymphae]
MIEQKEINKIATQNRVSDRQVEKDYVLSWLLFDFVKEETNIDMQIDPKKGTIHESGSPQFYIDYVASLQGSMGSRDLKIDITRGEILETASEMRNIFRTYSDLEEDFTLQCYSLAEVLIEKMAALMGRTQPRDLYDFWYLTEIEQLKVADHLFEFESKAKHKGQNPEKFLEKALGKELIFKRDWSKKLSSQIHDMPDFDTVFREAKRHFKY